MIQNTRELSSMKQTAGMLGVHLATVWRWALHGVKGRKLETIQIGGRRYVARAALEAFLAPRDAHTNGTDRDYARRANDARRVLDGLGVTTRDRSVAGRSSNM